MKSKPIDTVVIDDREILADPLFPEYFKKYANNVYVKRLETGDIIVDNFIVYERKTPQDFASSLCDGRITKQQLKMKENFKHRILVMVGNTEKFKEIHNCGGVHLHCVYGKEASLYFKHKIPIFWVYDNEGFAYFVANSSEKIKAISPLPSEVQQS